MSGATITHRILTLKFHLTFVLETPSPLSHYWFQRIFNKL